MNLNYDAAYAASCKLGLKLGENWQSNLDHLLVALMTPVVEVTGGVDKEPKPVTKKEAPVSVAVSKPAPKTEKSQKKGAPKVTIYTDGACSGNPGPGGWAAVLMFGEHKKEIVGGCESTTNNRMELCAVIRALEALKLKSAVEINTDSTYVINGWNSLERWKLSGWRTAGKKPIANIELWQQLDELIANATVGVRFNKIAGHSGNELNERCDTLAKAQIKVPAAPAQATSDEKKTA